MCGKNVSQLFKSKFYIEPNLLIYLIRNKENWVYSNFSTLSKSRMSGCFELILVTYVFILFFQEALRNYLNRVTGDELAYSHLRKNNFNKWNLKKVVKNIVLLILVNIEAAVVLQYFGRKIIFLILHFHATQIRFSWQWKSFNWLIKNDKR